MKGVGAFQSRIRLDEEKERQIHLKSTFRAAFIQYLIFIHGASGEFQNGHYAPEHPEYDPRNTLWHLTETIRVAENALTHKKRPFHDVPSNRLRLRSDTAQLFCL